jgi:hypothetical protein
MDEIDDVDLAGVTGAGCLYGKVLGQIVDKSFIAGLKLGEWNAPMWTRRLMGRLSLAVHPEYNRVKNLEFSNREFPPSPR